MRTLRLLIVVAVAACASTSGGGERSSYDPYLITRTEIEGTHYDNAHQIVSALRSRWLAPVAGASLSTGPGVVRVYVDGQPGQGLQSIPTMLIQEIRFYPPTEAQARWGLSHTRGAIEVITRKAGQS